MRAGLRAKPSLLCVRRGLACVKPCRGAETRGVIARLNQGLSNLFLLSVGIDPKPWREKDRRLSIIRGQDQPAATLDIRDRASVNRCAT